MSTPSSFRVEEVGWTQGADALGAVRREVFVNEQRVPEALEWDGLDPQCRHVLARTADGAPIATGRLLPDGHLGRMAVLREWRGRGIGRAVLLALLEIARSRGDRAVILHAQTHAIEFYRSTGFRVTSAEFMEAGIPHVAMTIDFPESPFPLA